MAEHKQRRVFPLADTIRRVRDEDPGIDIPLGDGGSPVFVPDPSLWSDVALEQADKNPVAAARDILGEAEYARFAAAGGTAALLFKTIEFAQQADVGESDTSTS